MCLGIPGRIIEMDAAEHWAVIESFGVQNRICTHLVGQDIAIGDYVMVHAGYAIGKMEASEANETLGLLETIARDFGPGLEEEPGNESSPYDATRVGPGS